MLLHIPSIHLLRRRYVVIQSYSYPTAEVVGEFKIAGEGVGESDVET